MLAFLRNHLLPVLSLLSNHNRMQFEMIFVVVAATLLQGGYSGFVSIRMPYLNPAGVTYIDNVQPEAHFYGVPARVEAQHVGYAAAQVPAVAAVPFVKHVPTVSHVPVTKIEAQHALSKTPKGPAVVQPLYPQFEAGPTVVPPVVSSTPTPNDDETVVVENPDFRNGVGAQTRSSINGAQSGEPFVAHDPSPGVVVSPQSSP